MKAEANRENLDIVPDLFYRDGMLRYECWRARDDRLFVLTIEDQWDGLPYRITSQGPWTGCTRGWVEDLKAHYRMLLIEQGFVVFCRKPTAMQLERYKHRILPRHTG